MDKKEIPIYIVIVQHEDARRRRRNLERSLRSKTVVPAQVILNVSESKMRLMPILLFLVSMLTAWFAHAEDSETNQIDDPLSEWIAQFSRKEQVLSNSIPTIIKTKEFAEYKDSVSNVLEKIELPDEFLAVCLRFRNGKPEDRHAEGKRIAYNRHKLFRRPEDGEKRSVEIRPGIFSTTQAPPDWSKVVITKADIITLLGEPRYKSDTKLIYRTHYDEGWFISELEVEIDNGFAVDVDLSSGII